ncbi:hypothetical protein [Paenibacillus polymyxa]|uniref:hypothetical protein n=1 Tax=Paenibacillus polymyxa TaxID=1406 RepID=UPI002ED5C397|nr:hypothetical protein [Paenibacillus polymyxa]
MKKLIGNLLISISLLLWAVMPAYSYAEQSNQYNYEFFQSEKIQEHQVVKEYIYQKGFEKYLKSKDQLDEEIINLYNLETMASDTTPDESELGMNSNSVLDDTYGEAPKVTSEKEAEIAKEYGLVKPETHIKEFDQHILVQRNKINNSIMNIWYINYICTNYGFTIMAINIGDDPLDVISGTLKKYNKNKDNWRVVATKKFNKTLVNTGKVFSWNNSRNAVSDYFEYDIVVSDNGSTFKYDNHDKLNYKRYYFDANKYNILKALGGERHHFVSDNALTSEGFNAKVAPAVRMLYRDHLNTPSWGSRASSLEFRSKEQEFLKKKDFKELLRFEVSGLKEAADSEGDYKNLQEKYYDSLVTVLLLSEKYFGIEDQT